MSERGELLELLHGARHRYRTVRLAFRTRHNRELGLRALARYEPEMLEDWDSESADLEELPETATRLWFEPPGRVREEHQGGGGSRTAIRDGAHWWVYDDRGGAYSNEDEPDVDTEVGETGLQLLDPAPFISALALEPEGRVRVAGREAILARGRPRHQDRRAVGFRLELLADEVELAVDAERGVILRRRDLVDEESAMVIEVEEIAFDEDFPAETFAPLPGVEITPQQGAREVDPEDVAELATFPVLLPRGLGSDWVVSASYFPGRPDREEEYVALEIANGAAYRVVVLESREGELGWDDFAWESVERGGQRFEIARPSETSDEGAVRFERAGTLVLLRSSSLDADTLLELAGLLEPANR